MVKYGIWAPFAYKCTLDTSTYCAYLAYSCIINSHIFDTCARHALAIYAKKCNTANICISIHTFSIHTRAPGQRTLLNIHMHCQKCKIQIMVKYGIWAPFAYKCTLDTSTYCAYLAYSCIINSHIFDTCARHALAIYAKKCNTANICISIHTFSVCIFVHFFARVPLYQQTAIPSHWDSLKDSSMSWALSSGILRLHCQGPARACRECLCARAPPSRTW